MPNLVLVHQRTKQAYSDYETIARQIGERTDDIAVHIVDTKEPQWAEAARVAADPTLVVSPMPIKKFTSQRGRVCQGCEYPKTEQYGRLRALGIPVPDWAEIVPGISLDPEEWGPYVVVKPDLGRKGAEIRIKRTGRVAYRAQDDFPDDHPGRKASMFAQKFVYTGRWPKNYRIVTLFGTTLMCWLCEADHGYPPLEERYAFGGGGVTIVSNKKTSHYSLADDAEVIALAERTHAAFPEQPLLGTDIVRDAETGEMFVLETNPRGDTWYMSSAAGRMIQDANGVDFAGQFGSLDIAADVLIASTRELAL